MSGHCPNHGPYDGSACPYPPPHGNEGRPQIPTLDDEAPTDLGLTEIPTWRRRGRFLDEDEMPKKFRTEGKSYNLRIFVSSTFEDLREYRETVFKAIHSMLGYADDMLFWSADERDALAVSLDRVRQCDLVILLIAHRYGFIPAGQKYSITELEYRTAKQANIPTLSFFVDEKIPWPPSYIELDKQEELGNFKHLIERDVIRKTFSSEHELHALVTEALHHFIERHRKSLEERQFRTTILVKSSTELTTQPDTVIQIGESEENLPLLLNIKRSKDLGSYIDELASSIESDPFDDSFNELLDSFRDQLERRAAKVWASNNIFSVQLEDGSEDEMYITKRNLASLTSSLLFRILENSKYHPVSHLRNTPNPATIQESTYFDEDDDITELPTSGDTGTSDTSQLQSKGGLNRFLGVSTINNHVYAVGINSGNWVVWHPFYHESISPNFPNCKFQIYPYSSEEIGMKSFKNTLGECFIDNMDDMGFLDANIQLILSRQSIGHSIVRIANAVASYHSKGKIHGDLKPKNILLTKNGPILIDSLDLHPGDLSPGFTANWAAPEQILRTPIDYAADIYPLGLLVLNTIGGLLLGEVRKFIVPTLNDPEKEHKVFYNPSVLIEGSEIIKRGKKEWITFIESCLKFDSSLRPKSAQKFASKLEILLENYPLNGNVSVNLHNGRLVAATLLDGSKKISHLISDKT